MALPSHEAQRSLRAITEAAERLLGAQTSSIRERESALEALAEVSSGLDLAFRSFRQPVGIEPAPLDWSELVAVAALEFQSANILAAASVVAGETAPLPGVAPADLLGRAVEDAKAELSHPRTTQGFGGPAPRGEPSPNVTDAIDSFKKAANQTIDSIVKDSERVVSSLFTEIKKKGKDILGAFDGVAAVLSDESQIVGLLKSAWGKLRSGLKFLSQILEALPVKEIREKVEFVAKALSLRHGIELLYETSETRDLIRELRLRPDLLESEIDAYRDRLTQLGKDFTRFVRTAIAISGLASSAAAIFAAHFTGPLAVLAVPATHALVAAVVLVVGIGLNDAWVAIRRVQGIRDIARGVALVKAEST
jgi:hypothetical protein